MFGCVQELSRLLAAVNQRLAQFGGGVNRKALEQYTSFMEQQEDFARRKVGLYSHPH